MPFRRIPGMTAEIASQASNPDGLAACQRSRSFLLVYLPAAIFPSFLPLPQAELPPYGPLLIPSFAVFGAVPRTEGLNIAPTNMMMAQGGRNPRIAIGTIGLRCGGRRSRWRSRRRLNAVNRDSWWPCDDRPEQRRRGSKLAQRFQRLASDYKDRFPIFTGSFTRPTRPRRVLRGVPRRQRAGPCIAGLEVRKPATMMAAKGRHPPFSRTL